MGRNSLLVIGAIIVDFIVGDPSGLWHPVCGIGFMIEKLMKQIRKRLPKTKGWEYFGGSLLVFLVLLITGGIVYGILWMAERIHPCLSFLIELFLCYQIMATKSLKTESMKVFHALRDGTIQDARHAVSMIVGRDTENLDEEGIIKATVETIAENTTDGCIAPICFILCFGALGGFFYKAVNTMDSMIGYKNEKYRYFGTCAAKLDDLVNYIPARVAAVGMILAGILHGSNGKEIVRIFLRDRYNHASPNSAQTEAVMAGILGVQLAGDAYYFGTLYKKKTIGNKKKKIVLQDIVTANRILYTTVIITAVILCFFALNLENVIKLL